MNAVAITGYTTTLSALLEGIVEVDKSLDREISGLSLDSRSARDGDLFFARSGTRRHGLEYAQQAVDNGAVAVAYEVVEDRVVGRDETPIRAPESSVLRSNRGSVPFLAVSNLSQYLGEVAARFYRHPSRDLFVVGVTGTNGKTSSSQYIAQALSIGSRYPGGSACGVIGTLGSGIYGALNPALHTTPDAITLQAMLCEMRDAGVPNVVMEVSSHGLSQGRVNGIAFDVAVFTNLSREHLDYHDNMATYGEAKQRLFQMPGLRCAVVNVDDPFGRELAAALPNDVRLISFSLESDRSPHRVSRPGLGADLNGHVQGADLHVHADGFHMRVHTSWGDGSVHSELLGRFNASNLLAVLSVLLAMGIPVSEALRRIAATRPVPGRMERFGGGSGLPLVVVDYAHTPDALEHVLTTLKEHCAGRLWCVFGCGGNRDRGKRPMMGSVAEAIADAIVLTDDNPRNEDGSLIIEEILSGIGDRGMVFVERDRARAVRHAFTHAVENDVVLIAGKGHETTQQIGGEAVPFSDRDVVVELIGGATP